MFQVMSVEVLKPCHNTEDVIALKKYIQKAQADQERHKEVIAHNKEKDEFLLAHRFALPEEDFEIAYKAYEWPRKMVDILKEATTKVGMTLDAPHP